MKEWRGQDWNAARFFRARRPVAQGRRLPRENPFVIGACRSLSSPPSNGERAGWTTGFGDGGLSLKSIDWRTKNRFLTVGCHSFTPIAFLQNSPAQEYQRRVGD
jgi:hypothetical protein